MHTCAHTHTHTHTHTYTCKHTRTHVNTHTHMPTCAHTHTHTCKHTHTHTHSYTHTQTHSYTHTCTHTHTHLLEDGDGDALQELVGLLHLVTSHHLLGLHSRQLPRHKRWGEREAAITHWNSQLGYKSTVTVWSLLTR